MTSHCCVLKNPSAMIRKEDSKFVLFQIRKMQGKRKRNQRKLGGRRQFVRPAQMHSCKSFFVTFSTMHIKCCKKRISSNISANSQYYL